LKSVCLFVCCNRHNFEIPAHGQLFFSTNAWHMVRYMHTSMSSSRVKAISCLLVVLLQQSSSFLALRQAPVTIDPKTRFHLDLLSTRVEEFGSHRQDPDWQKRSKRWIILVDDEEAIRKAVGQLLSDEGYQVTACADGPTTLEVLLAQRQRSKKPDVIVSDIRMPGMDGLELLRLIRADESLVEVPVILLTAKGQSQDRIEGYNAGADGYLSKPFDPLELVAMVDGVIERHNIVSETVAVEDLQRDLDEIKFLLQKGGGGIGNGWVEQTNVFLAQDERQVLELLCQGLMNKEIAEQTYLSTRRVEQLLTGMFRKVQVKNRTELVRWAISTGTVLI
jgi:DNA-binding NarL/FixJ family response regulator